MTALGEGVAIHRRQYDLEEMRAVHITRGDLDRCHQRRLGQIHDDAGALAREKAVAHGGDHTRCRTRRHLELKIDLRQIDDGALGGARMQRPGLHGAVKREDETCLFAFLHDFRIDGDEIPRSCRAGDPPSR